MQLLPRGFDEFDSLNILIEAVLSVIVKYNDKFLLFRVKVFVSHQAINWKKCLEKIDGDLHTICRLPILPAVPLLQLDKRMLGSNCDLAKVFFPIEYEAMEIRNE